MMLEICKKLSNERTKSVLNDICCKRYYSQLVVIYWGRGQEKPVVDNRTEEGRVKTIVLKLSKNSQIV
jgi:outer membrane protein OmpA-like peptidoglycan-associated protein